MNALTEFKLAGIALPKDAAGMLDEVCEHFIEHAEVRRTGDAATLRSEIGTAHMRIEAGRLLIDLSCPTQEALQITWSGPAPRTRPATLHEITVVSASDVTPRMRRVVFACPDITPFIGGDMHVRLLVPPKGRAPVWPGLQEDGRIAWPRGEDALVVRAYTIRAIDEERGEIAVDFLQHPAAGIATPGADFARDARPGDKAALLGPGGGGLPQAGSILLAGDETALPAIARIAAEVPAGTRMQAIIEVEDEAEEQPLPTAGSLDVRWLHRAGSGNMLAQAALQAVAEMDDETFVWLACEREDVRRIRAALKSRGHDRKRIYAAWYWERERTPSSH